MRRTLLLLAAVVLLVIPLAAIPLLGTSAVIVTPVLAVVFAVGYLWQSGGRGLGVGLAMLGAVVGGANAVLALVRVGGNPNYHARVGFGWAALVLALIARLTPLMRGQRRVLASVLTAGAGLSGAVASTLFDIDTFYVVAVPLWLASPMVLLAGSLRQPGGL